MKSTHRTEVIRVRLEPHPNADSLSIVRPWGYTVCVRTADWKDGDLGAYVVPDSIVPNSPTFAFLGEHRRVKVRRLRGVLSQGLLVPAPEGAQEGDDVASILGVTRYEPPLPMSTGGEDERPPAGWRPVYDVESWHRYRHLLVEGETIIVTEKIHGCNARYTFQDGRMHCGSRTTWKRESDTNLWWRALRQSPWIEGWCREHEGVTLYGEVFGQVQDLKYGAGRNDLFFRAFDAWGKGWMPQVELQTTTAQMVPTLFVGPYSEEKVRELATGQSTFADHIREGCVIRPVVQRDSEEIGRVVLKLVSDAYLER